jgi:hypothetical protein
MLGAKKLSQKNRKKAMHEIAVRKIAIGEKVMRKKVMRKIAKGKIAAKMFKIYRYGTKQNIDF